MFHYPYKFLIGFAIGFLPTLYYLVHHLNPPIRPQVEAAYSMETLKDQNKPDILVNSIVEITPTPSPTPKETPTPTITPSPEPTATPDVWPPASLEPIFSEYAGQYAVDKNILERLANCESHFNPDAMNGDYLGMFQFSTQTWQSYRGRMGLDPNPELRRDIHESIKTAAFVISQSGTGHWPRCLN